ncbi:MAG TPA: UDP-2,4-diacetamido-2,4,6-trideoxy-beta-L-altropyranose hydrolase [Isosphaeraceae bacterium]|nr:UDP-2,4-diacetamido-2,4,6-trideoxy-beta-L-altropyranose hydrolase [Isosphaeraceae bacterium]
MGSPSHPLAIRADAGARMGTGHLMRCLALAQAWHDAGGSCVFLAAELPAALEDRLATEGMPVRRVRAEPGSAADAEQTARLARATGAAWVVVDGYGFGTSFQRALKQAGLWVLAHDDYGHCDHYHADLVLNQNLHAEEAPYRRREPSTRLLLGTDYVLLRREFLAYGDWERAIPGVGRKVLVTLGGADPENITERVIPALGMVPIEGLEAVVVVGGSNPHLNALRGTVARSGLRCELRVNVSDMAGLMAWADAAVTAGGSSVWELARLGVPALGIGRAPQETQLLRGAAARGMVIDLGFHRDVTPELIAVRLARLLRDPAERARLSQTSRRMVDGMGPRRVLQAMSETEQGPARA